MKTLQLLLLLLILPAAFHAQKSLTGLWMGVLSNDSNTIRKDQSFEIALTQYKEKVYGYTRSSFIVNDTLYYIVKRVKGTIDGDVCEIKDDEVISSNFRGRVDKGVKVTTIFRMNKRDTSWYLAGEWKTNKTKNFYSVSGKVDLKEESNLDNSKIFPHLEELKIADDVAFYKESKKPIATAQVEKKPEPAQKKEEPIIKKKEEPLASLEPEKKKKKTKKEEVLDSTKNPAAMVTVPKPVDERNTNKDSTIITKKSADKPVKEVAIPRKEIVPDIIKPAVAAAFVQERKTVPPQIVEFKSDSLELALYDNGEVDGDTVSVLLNGEVIIAKQGLKTSASKKTIYVQPGSDELILVLYAENLGKYPPNTGLLVVHDGEDVYQVRFSADLQQNASVIFRRKRK